MNTQVGEMFHNNTIRPSSSPWNSPILIVKQKDGTNRFVCDFRAFNDVTRKDAFVITPEMVQEKIQELNLGKTPGPDGWLPVFLKYVSDLITVPMSILFQKTLCACIVSSQWLEACVTAIHKKEKRIYSKITDQSVSHRLSVN